MNHPGEALLMPKLSWDPDEKMKSFRIKFSVKTNRLSSLSALLILIYILKH